MVSAPLAREMVRCSEWVCSNSSLPFPSAREPYPLPVQAIVLHSEALAWCQYTSGIYCETASCPGQPIQLLPPCRIAFLHFSHPPSLSSAWIPIQQPLHTRVHSVPGRFTPCPSPRSCQTSPTAAPSAMTCGRKPPRPGRTRVPQRRA